MNKLGSFLLETLRLVVDPDKGTAQSSSRADELSLPDTTDREPITNGSLIDPEEIAQYTLSCPRCGYAVMVEAQFSMSFESIVQVKHGIPLHVVIAGKQS